MIIDADQVSGKITLLQRYESKFYIGQIQGHEVSKTIDLPADAAAKLALGLLSFDSVRRCITRQQIQELIALLFEAEALKDSTLAELHDARHAGYTLGVAALMRERCN